MRARLFVAIDLPPAARATLAALAPRGERGVRPVAEENLHVTLKFLGDAEIEPVAEALERVHFAPFSWSVRGVGFFLPPRRGPTLWAGFDENPAATELHGAVDRALSELGFARDRSPFTPHVTLARCDARAPRGIERAFVRGNESLAIPGLAVSTFVLRASVLRPEGPSYTDVRVYGANR